MNNKAYRVIVDTLQDTLTSHGYKLKKQDENEYFIGDERCFRVSYDDDAKLFRLQTCETADRAPSNDWTDLESWLFDESHDERDAKSIGGDFLDSVKKNLGLTPSKSVGNKVIIPSKKTHGDYPTIDTFAGRFLDMYPEYKAEYKANLENYDEFLYADFFAKTAAVKLRDLLRKNEAKALKKYIELLNEMYVEGDQTVGSTVTCIIFGGAISGTDLWETAEKYLADYQFLKTACLNVLKYMKNRKEKGA